MTVSALLEAEETKAYGGIIVATGGAPCRGVCLVDGVKVGGYYDDIGGGARNGGDD
jgi:hypothetical protein